MEYDVTQDRNEYIGGSDIPCIMGISTFNTRWNLLLEKAGLKDKDFFGNVYTEYGKKLEPQIRDYINQSEKQPFVPNRVIKDDLRAHSDGFNGKCILEIKTTSQIYDDVNDYMVYLVQLLFYMDLNGVKKGKLAVYERTEEMNEEFNPLYLTVYDIKASDYKELLSDIYEEIARFRSDLKKLKNNPLLSEEDFQPPVLVTLSKEVLALEKQFVAFKDFEKRYKDMKQKLYEAMQAFDVKSWRTIGGVKITRVDGTEAVTITEDVFNVDLFEAENPELYKLYLETVEKKKAGRSGYVKITLPKGTET